MIKTPSKSKTITRTFTIREDLFERFKKEMPDRSMSALINEFIEGCLSRKALRESYKHKFTKEESIRFEKTLKDADKIALIDEAKMLKEFKKI